MSLHTESKLLIGNNDSESISYINSLRNSVVATETTPYFPEDTQFKKSSTNNRVIKNNLANILQPKFFRLGSSPMNSLALSESINMPIESPKESLIKDHNFSEKNNGQPLTSSIINEDQEKEKQKTEKDSKVHIRSKRSRWKTLLNNSGEKKKGLALSANASEEGTPNIRGRRRRMTHDFTHNGLTSKTQEENKSDEAGKTVVKKPGTDFRLEHFKILKKQIENEKKVLAEDIKEAVEEKVRRNSVLNLSQGSQQKWQKAKKNLLILARVKRLNDDLRLWGSSMNVSGLNTEKKDLKMLMPENQFDATNNEKKRIKWMIYPHTILSNLWYIIYVMIMLYTAFVTPIRIAFWDSLPNWWTALEITIDVLFGIDILVTLNSAIVLENGEIMDSRRRLFWKYLKGWLIWDIFAILPWYVLLEAVDERNDHAYSDLIKLVRLPRLYKLIKMTRLFRVAKKVKKKKSFQDIRDKFQIGMYTWKIISFVMVLILSIHVFACMWFFSAKFYRFAPRTWVFEYIYFL